MKIGEVDVLWNTPLIQVLPCQGLSCSEYSEWGKLMMAFAKFV